MLKKPSDSLSHVTIFEDASYIAARRLLESSKLSTYLEDIALLLRGKGEALITLTSSLDISRNIIQNAGSKFFFKFNEKKEEVIHNIGFNSSDLVDINQLNVGFCIAKIDSIPYPFLFKPRFISMKKNAFTKLNSNQKKTKDDQIHKKEKERNRKKEISDESVKPIKTLSNKIKLDSNEELELKNDNIIENKKGKSDLMDEKVTPENKSKLNDILNVSLFHFDNIIGPYLYYKFGTYSFDKEQTDHLVTFMNYRTGNYVIEFKNTLHFLYLFEIDSKWARGGKELLEIAISIQKDGYNKQESNNEGIFNNLLDSIKKIRSNDDFYQAFYLYSKEKKKYLNEILDKKRKIVEILKFLFHQTYKLINFDIIQEIFSNTPDIFQELNDLEKIIDKIRVNEGLTIQ